MSSSSIVRLAAIAILLLCGSIVMGCGDPAEPVRTDEEIRQEVLATLEAEGLQGTDVVVNAGVVLLRGEVPTQADVERAVAAVRRIPGVESVETQLQAQIGEGSAPVALPPEQNPDVNLDARQAARVDLALKANAGLAGSRIVPTAQGGTVTLTGTVPSEQAKIEAERVARGVPGVTAVENRLQVKAEAVETVPDSQIETKVRELLDESYPALLVTIAVENGIVKLRGAVDSRAQVKQIADRVYQIQGVKSVDTSLLTVIGGEEGDRIGAPAGE